MASPPIESDVLDAWQSFVQGAKPFKKNSLGGGLARNNAADLIKLEAVMVETAEHDATFAAVNQANARLIKRTGQPLVAAKMEAVNKRAQQMLPPKKPSAASIAAKKKREDKGKEEEDDDDGDAAAEKKKKSKVAPAVEVVVVEQPRLMEAKLPVLTLEEHKRRDDKLALFALSVERPHHRATTEMISKTPPAVGPGGVLNYCSLYKGEMPWYTLMQQRVANSDRLTFQKIPVFRRSVLVTFLRQPDPRCPYERPCFNLDREPLAHESMVRCIAHRLSEEHWGPGKGYRLRELIFNEQQVKMNNAKDPMQYLSPIPEMCYMCHVWLTTEACLDQKNKEDERQRKDMATSGNGAPKAAISILHRFMVDIDKPGEYDRRMMLCSDDVALGVEGPFPLWNKKNYLPVRVISGGTTTFGFEESEALLFRLPRVPSQVTASSQQSGSTQSNPMSAGQAGLTSRP